MRGVSTNTVKPTITRKNIHVGGSSLEPSENSSKRWRDCLRTDQRLISLPCSKDKSGKTLYA